MGIAADFDFGWEGRICPRNDRARAWDGLAAGSASNLAINADRLAAFIDVSVTVLVHAALCRVDLLKRHHCILAKAVRASRVGRAEKELQNAPRPQSLPRGQANLLRTFVTTPLTMALTRHRLSSSGNRFVIAS
jgi:hypothetical protein